MASEWARSKAAQYLFGDNFPSGAEKHIDALAPLLDEIRRETVELCSDAVKRTQKSAHQARDIGRIVREFRHLLPPT